MSDPSNEPAASASASLEAHGPGAKRPPTLWEDIRLIFATILTDPGSSLAYGADALVAVTAVLFLKSFELGAAATFTAGGVIMLVYLIAILVYNSMTRHHVHKVLGGGAFVSSLITSNQIRTPWLKKAVGFLGKTGTASLLADFPATQAISLIAGVEALSYFIGPDERLPWAFGFLIALSLVQRYGLGNLARFMIWPVAAFYVANLGIQLAGLFVILEQGMVAPTIPDSLHSLHGLGAFFGVIVLAAVANGATLITGVEVGYSSVNFPYHKGKAIRISMWILYVIVLCTYMLQLFNFMGLGVSYDRLAPLPIVIAARVGELYLPAWLGADPAMAGAFVAGPFGILTAIMLLLAAQTAHSDFPLEILRASRSNFFPRGIGDSAWRRTKPVPAIGGHEGVYNPSATLLLGVLSLIILYFFPGSHAIESMYGLAVVTAMSIDIFAYMLRQLRARKLAIMTVLGLLTMVGMLVNIVYNKFFDGAWFIVLLMGLYIILFLVSEAIYKLWQEKLNLVPLEFGLSYPAFQGLPVDRKNMVLISKFHPGVIHFLRNYVKSGHMPMAVHFQTDPDESIPEDMPEWFENIVVPQGMDTITAITKYIKETQPERVHLIPLLVRGLDPIKHFYFGNSIEALKHAISEHADLQVEYNRERIVITFPEIWRRIFPFLERARLNRMDREYREKHRDEEKREESPGREGGEGGQKK